MRTQFDRFAKKYLEQEDDSGVWVPRSDSYVMFYPIGSDAYRRLVLGFYKGEMTVLSPKWLDVDANFLFDYLKRHHHKHTSRQGLKILVDTYDYDDNPDIFNEIIVFNRWTMTKV
jgi:hypothetical protein